MPIDPTSDFTKPLNLLTIGSIVIGAIAAPLKYFASKGEVKRVANDLKEHKEADQKWQELTTTTFTNAIESLGAQVRVDLREHRQEVAKEIQNQFEKIDNFVTLFQTLKAMKEAEKKNEP